MFEEKGYPEKDPADKQDTVLHLLEDVDFAEAGGPNSPQGVGAGGDPYAKDKEQFATYKKASPAEQVKLVAGLIDYADALIADTDEKSSQYSRDKIPGEVISKYEKALEIKKEVYEKNGQKNDVQAKEIASLIIRLTDFSGHEKAIKYLEDGVRSIANPKSLDLATDPISFGVLHMETAKHYFALAQEAAAKTDPKQQAAYEQSGKKHFDQANIYWKTSPSILSKEREGDRIFRDKDYAYAADFYKEALKDLDSGLFNICSRREPSPPNLHQGQLHEKIAYCFMAKDNVKPSIDDLTTALMSLQIAEDTLNEYGLNYGTSRGQPSEKPNLPMEEGLPPPLSVAPDSTRILPEQLRILAASVLVECKLAARDTEHETDHLSQADILVNKLTALEKMAAKQGIMLDQGNNYGIGAGDEELNHGLIKLAKSLSKTPADNKHSAEILERLYAMQIAQGKSTIERICTLQAVSQASLDGGDQQKCNRHLAEVAKVIKGDSIKDEQQLIPILKDLAVLAEKSGAYDQQAYFLERQDKLQSKQGESSDARVDTLKRLASAYYSAHRDEPARQCIEKVIQIVEAEFNKNQQRMDDRLQKNLEGLDRISRNDTGAAQLMQRFDKLQTDMGKGLIALYEAYDRDKSIANAAALKNYLNHIPLDKKAAWLIQDYGSRAQIIDVLKTSGQSTEAMNLLNRSKTMAKQAGLSDATTYTGLQLSAMLEGQQKFAEANAELKEIRQFLQSNIKPLEERNDGKTLPDLYHRLSIVLKRQAEFYERRNNLSEAKIAYEDLRGHIQKWFGKKITMVGDTVDDFRKAHEGLARIYEQTNQPDLAKKAKEVVKRLTDPDK